MTVTLFSVALMILVGNLLLRVFWFKVLDLRVGDVLLPVFLVCLFVGTR